MWARTNTMMVLNAALSLFLALVSLSWSLLDIYNWLSGPWADLDKRHPETTPGQPQKTPTWVRGIPAFPMHPSKCFFCLVFGCSLPPRKPQNSVPGPRDEPKGIPKPIKKNSPGTMEFRDINAHPADGPRKTHFIYIDFPDRLFSPKKTLHGDVSEQTWSMSLGVAVVMLISSVLWFGPALAWSGSGLVRLSWFLLFSGKMDDFCSVRTLFSLYR